MTEIKALWARLVRQLEHMTWLPMLLMRLFLGAFFFETGLAKAQNLADMAQRFSDWGIPAPAFHAALSAYTELIGGALVAVGLLTRVACVPLVINMVVAVLAVKAANVGSLSDFVELDEPLYALGFLWLLFAGPGRVSLDQTLQQLQQSQQLKAASRVQERPMTRPAQSP
jgi:putative oxidoreductase